MSIGLDLPYVVDCIVGESCLDVRGNISEVRFGPDLRVLDGIAAWCGGLHGSMSLQEALSALADGLGARTAAISRHYHRSERAPRAVALFDCESNNSDTPILLKRALCQDVLGYLFAKARAATIWFESDLSDDPAWHPTEVLKNWKLVREIDEVVVISLATSHQHNDFIEFHFSRELTRAERLELETLVQTIVRSWNGRTPGLVTQATVDERFMRARREKEAMQWDVPLLSMANPAGLSRAEFRVCVLISHGLSIKGICDELNLAENTVRSHLRAIYGKTGASGMAELLYRILSSGKDASEGGAQVGFG